jgi:organic radical activating enzyme
MSDYLKRTKDVINSISPSFCAAKWYNASIWLNSGRTASCHHPEAHFISTSELMQDPSALHNTSVKKEARKEMLEGIRPSECSYCWRVEDLNNENIHSDRVYKSMVYNLSDVIDISTIDPNVNVDPKNLEISFDNLCNLACSYCNPEFSTTWGNDIATNGPYKNMKTNGGHTFENDGQHGMPFGTKNIGNFYINKFFEWYDSSLRKSLQELRITGGEPTRSPHFWRLIEKFDKETFSFAVNTNLMIDSDKLKKLAQIKKQFKKYDIYTSCESYGENAEFVRSGLIYNDWKSNLEHLQYIEPDINTHIMMTISALSIWTVDKFLDDIVSMRKNAVEKINKHKPYYHMSVNILRFPSFQSVNILPKNVKLQISHNIRDSVHKNKDYMTAIEVNNYNRCIEYLEQVDISYEDSDSYESKINDFKNFVIQYSIRKNCSLNKMPNKFNDWFDTL